MTDLPPSAHGTPDARVVPNDVFEPTVLAWRPLSEWGDVRAQVIRSDTNVAEIMLGLVRETAAAVGDEPRLLDVIHDFSFRAFPNASHLTLAERDAGGELRTRISRTRDSRETQDVQLSRTITDRVMREGCALLYAHDQGRQTQAESIVLSRLETAICAPLLDQGVAHGVLQLDVRRPSRGRFTREDVDLLSVFASQVGLVLQHQSMVQQQKRAFESTVNALVRALALRDPESIGHPERVRALATAIGRHMGVSGVKLDVLGWAALLHNLGEQGLHHQTFIRPDRITPAERDEITRHAAETQAIIDLIEYPEPLRDVTRVAALLNTKPDAEADADPATRDVRLLARIISVADLCDALLTFRVGMQALPPALVLELLARGKGKDWEPAVVDATREIFDRLLSEVYGSAGHEDGETPSADGERRAA
jgi:HD-GYP domain-containing protein (c-di-GMP phosphodiesterase class II)